jgi:ATP-dependent Zn protease
MNDGQQPKRNIFTYILPYILMAITVALFVWLIVSQTMGTTNVWSESNLDAYIGAYNTTTSSWVVDADGAHGLKNATVSQGYKAVTVTGTYFDKNNSERSYSVLIEENKWNADFEATYTDSNKQVVTYTHASYAYVFNSVIAKAKAGAPATSVDQYYVKVTDAFQVSWWDTWGPTIIMIGVVTILGIIFFIRLNGSVNGANRQAMDFNKSPARREDASKVRFTMWRAATKRRPKWSNSSNT